MSKRAAEISETEPDSLKSGGRPQDDNAQGDVDFEDEYEDEYETEDEAVEEVEAGGPDENRQEPGGMSKHLLILASQLNIDLVQFQDPTLDRKLTMAKQMQCKWIKPPSSQVDINWPWGRPCHLTHQPTICSILLLQPGHVSPSTSSMMNWEMIEKAIPLRCTP